MHILRLDLFYPVTATSVVCCILMQILCVVSQKSFSFWGTLSPVPQTPYWGSAPGPRWGTSVPQTFSLLLCPPNNFVRSTPLFCTNSSHHPKRPLVIFVPVAMASPVLLYPRSSGTKTFCTICYTKMYINLKTYVIHITEIVVHNVCLYCRLCVCHSLD